jgi:hypothetical protein
MNRELLKTKMNEYQAYLKSRAGPQLAPLTFP